uniref:Transaldolase n=3 Tax=Chlamydomonas euryale TaxID=1486919 RepID=A0A7R9VML0_9CHLO|mmetsp:Transcript_38964/g.115888  ORF Transcript_38964/g.115888 Transcript_38964/m.115888 type:complete len:245 (+) Transcript_38964:1715-2449(+)
MVEKATALSKLYAEMRVPASKIIFRLPATWEGIQAAKQLESQGVTTQVYLVFSMIQAAAAAQAGVSVIQPNVGRLRECYAKFPNAIRDPNGPRQDAGYLTSQDPGIVLAQQIFMYVKKYHRSECRVMASGIRTKADALQLAGCDFILLPPKVIKELADTPTIGGYNDGLRVAGDTDADSEASLNAAAAADQAIDQLPMVTKEAFDAGLGFAAEELLRRGLEQQVADTAAAMPLFAKTTTLHSST